MVLNRLNNADLRIAAEEDEDQIKSHIELSERLGNGAERPVMNPSRICMSI